MKKQLIFSFDDGGIWDMKLAQMLLRYFTPGKARIIFYLPPEYKDFSNYDLIKQLNKMGMEIGSHTVSHTHLTKATYEQVKWELAESKKILEDIIKKPVKSFCYPRGYYNDDIKNYVKLAGYEDARTTKVFQKTIPDDPYQMHTTLHFYPYRMEYKKDWKEYARKFILDYAKGKNNYLHFWGHSNEIEKFNLWDDVEEILSYAYQNISR